MDILSILGELSWLKWVAITLVGLAVLGLFLRMGGHHLTEPFFRQCKVLLSTRAGRWLLRGVIITVALGGLGWSLYAGIQYLESAEQTRIASNEKRSRQEAYTLLYRSLGKFEKTTPPETTESAPTERPWYRAAIDKAASIFPDKEAAVLGCATKPFTLIEHNPEVIAIASIDNDGNARSMVIVVDEPESGLTERADMKLRITEQGDESGNLHWVVDRGTWTLRGFPDDTSYSKGVATVLDHVTRECTTEQ